jgi:hypothetical protein
MLEIVNPIERTMAQAENGSRLIDEMNTGSPWTRRLGGASRIGSLMILGPTYVICCPRCGHSARHRTVISGKTRDQRSWTDGKHRFPMLPQEAPVAKCEGCGSCFWRKEAEMIDLAARWFRKAPGADAKELKEPAETDYYAAISSHLAKDDQQERTLRLHAWWKRNDRWRLEQNPPWPGTPENTGLEWRDNLERLKCLLKDQDESECLFKADILRSLGRFAEALALLERTWQTSAADEFASALQELCEAQDARLRQVVLAGQGSEEWRLKQRRKRFKQLPRNMRDAAAGGEVIGFCESCAHESRGECCLGYSLDTVSVPGKDWRTGVPAVALLRVYGADFAVYWRAKLKRPEQELLLPCSHRGCKGPLCDHLDDPKFMTPWYVKLRGHWLDPRRGKCCRCGAKLASDNALLCLKCGLRWFDCPACGVKWNRGSYGCVACGFDLWKGQI